MKNKKYKVIFSKDAEKDLKKLDKNIARLLKKWILDNLYETENPRKFGKGLKGNLKGLWRYRVGSYRIICEIQDDILIIFVVELGNRKNIYD